MNKTKLPSNRNFGVVFFIVFLIIALWPFLKGENLRLWAFTISLLFLILGLLNAKILTPLNKMWIKFGEILGLVIAPIVMAIVYFIILTPISLIVRIFGKDLLGVNFSKKVNSYWIERKKKLGSMDKQF